MSEYTYPYIADKTEYAATMYACQLIRKYGTFNVACKTAARRYGISQDVVEKHVRARQGAGQKKAAKRNPRKYHYYLIETSDTGHSFGGYRYYIEKATSGSNARSHIDPGFYGHDEEYEKDCIERIMEFDSEDNARQEATKWAKQRNKEEKEYKEKLKQENRDWWNEIKRKWENGENVADSFGSLLFTLPSKEYIPSQDMGIYNEIVEAKGFQHRRAQ